MDNHFWSDEAARLYKEGHTKEEAIKIVVSEKDLYERSRSNERENLDKVKREIFTK